MNRLDSKNWDSLEREANVAEAAGYEIRAWIKSNLASMPSLMGMRLATHWGPYSGKSLIWKLSILLGVVMLLTHSRKQAVWMVGMPIVSSLTVMLLYETGGRFLVPLYASLYATAAFGLTMTGYRLASLASKKTTNHSNPRANLGAKQTPSP